MLEQILALGVAAGVGLTVGLVYFWGLWYTLQRLPYSRHPALLMLGSYLLRLGVVLGGLYLVMDGEIVRLGVALLGVLLARMLLVRRLRPTNSA